MKRVKVCPNCGLYNDKNNDMCSECGASLDDIIISVENFMTRDPEFAKKKQALKEAVEKSEAEEVKDTRPTASSDMIECPVCGTLNPASEEICSECGSILHAKAEETPAPAPAPEVKKEEPVKEPEPIKVEKPGINVIEMSCPYGKESLLLTEEVKSFGRENFFSPILKDYLKISRHHFDYFKKGYQVFIVDYSSNGTFINGNRLIKGVQSEVHNGDNLRLADLDFSITLC